MFLSDRSVKGQRPKLCYETTKTHCIFAAAGIYFKDYALGELEKGVGVQRSKRCKEGEVKATESKLLKADDIGKGTRPNCSTALNKDEAGEILICVQRQRVVIILLILIQGRTDIHIMESDDAFHEEIGYRPPKRPGPPVRGVAKVWSLDRCGDVSY